MSPDFFRISKSNVAVRTDDELRDELGVSQSELLLLMKNWKWRINHLYYIVSDMDGDAEKIIFKMTKAQEILFDNLHYKNIILKSRQHGITTFMVIFMLDQILFEPNVHCGFVAQDRDSAEDIFYKKVLYAYNNLPDFIRDARPTEKMSGKMIVIKHAGGSTSSIRVGTSLRSGTYSYIHISEYGKICAQDAQKAKEIISGCLNAGYSCVVTIESTAEGNYGRFFDIAQKAEFHTGSLTRMDYKFFFFGWTEHRRSVLECDPFDYGIELDAYFYQLEHVHGLKLSAEQKNWYAKKLGEQGDMMKQEYPSTSAEAFEQSMEGAYYAHELRQAHEDGRIREDLAYNPGYPVHTSWDLGIDDYTCLWFFQYINGYYHFIDYFELSDRSGLPGASNELKARPYSYGSHIGPWDISVTEFGTGMTRVEIARIDFGIIFQVAPKLLIKDGIAASRRILSKCIFNKKNCSLGLSRLANYRKKWDDKRQIFLEAPQHDAASHGADSFRTFATSSNLIQESLKSYNMIEEASNWTITL